MVPLYPSSLQSASVSPCSCPRRVSDTANDSTPAPQYLRTSYWRRLTFTTSHTRRGFSLHPSLTSAKGSLVRGSHSRIVRSSLPEARNLPSGE
ncbi:hypothetical protein K457DRAFT_1830036, partial [Linnemannia elongata AG-77]